MNNLFKVCEGPQGSKGEKGEPGQVVTNSPLAIELEDRTLQAFKIPDTKTGVIELKYFQRGGNQIYFYDSSKDKIICRTWTESSYTLDFDCVPGKTCYLLNSLNCIQGAMGGHVCLSLDIKENEVKFSFESQESNNTVEYTLNDNENVDSWTNYDGVTISEALKDINIDHVIVYSLNREESNEPTYIQEINVYNSNNTLLESIKPLPVFNPYLVFDIKDGSKLPYFKGSSAHVCNNNSCKIVSMDFVQKSQAWYNFVKEVDNEKVYYFSGSMYIDDETLLSNLINCSKFSVFFRKNADGQEIADVLTVDDIVELKECLIIHF